LISKLSLRVSSYDIGGGPLSSSSLSNTADEVDGPETAAVVPLCNLLFFLILWGDLPEEKKIKSQSVLLTKKKADRRIFISN
jgi:hypothetical protein